MNTDFRVAVDFFAHHKARKLKKRLGADGLMALLQLWAYAAKLRADGDLSGMTVEDIELASGWDGTEGALVAALVEVGFLDQNGEAYALHDWEDHQDVLRLKKIANGWEPGNRIEDIPMSAWKRLRVKIFSRDNYVCQYCGRKTERPHCDHVVPISRGGKSTQENLATACPTCNLSKGAKTLSEWRQ